MRFKEFLSLEDGGAATSIMHGGLMDSPSAYTNVNMPVRSKYVTRDGKEGGIAIDAASGKRKPDQTFGFRSPQDKNRTKERAITTIDRLKKGEPLVRIPPDTIY